MRLTILLLTIVSYSSIMHGQQLTDIGNNWYMGKVNWETETYYQFQIKIDADTVINSQNYRTLLRNDNLENPQWYRLNYYLREDNEKRVFILDSTGHEGILYHFGLELGEQVQLWNGINATLLSIDSVQVANNQYQKRYKIHAVKLGPLGEECGYITHWIDGIGDLGPIPSNYCPDIISYSIGCFFRTDGLFYPAESSWCEGFMTATKQIEESSLQVFPNPVTDFLSIQFNDGSYRPMDVQLYNVEGQLLYQNKTAENLQMIDMSQMANGIFILNIISPDHNLIVKKIVKQ